MKDYFYNKILPNFLGFSLLILSIIVLIYSGSMNVSGLKFAPKYTMQVWYACILLLLIFVVINRASKSKSGWDVSWLFVLISTPFLYMGLPIFINCYFDNGDKHTINAKVVDMNASQYKTKNGAGYSYFLTLDIDKPYQDFQKLSISESKYHLIKKDDRIEIDVRPGRLGYPWVKSYKVY